MEAEKSTQETKGMSKDKENKQPLIDYDKLKKLKADKAKQIKEQQIIKK